MPVETALTDSWVIEWTLSSDCIHHFVFINFLEAEAAEHNAVRDDFLFIGAMMFVFGCCQLWLCALSYLYDVYTVYIFPF